MTARARNPLQRGPRGSGSGSDRDGGGAQRPRLVDEELRTKWSQDDFARQMTRRWRPGDVYAPHDLSPSEMGKWRRNRARQQDLVDILGLKPLDMYRVSFTLVNTTSPPKSEEKKNRGSRKEERGKHTKTIEEKGERGGRNRKTKKIFC